MKIYLQTEIVDEFEFDALESFCTLPMITEKKMIITNFLGLIYLTENTLRKVSNELKKILDKEKTKSFRLKKVTLTITELTAYSVRVGKKMKMEFI